MIGVGVTGRLIVEFEDVNLPISLSWEQMVILFDELGIEISDDRKKVTMYTSNALDERLNKAFGFDSLELDEFGVPIESNAELEKERIEAEKKLEEDFEVEVFEEPELDVLEDFDELEPIEEPELDVLEDFDELEPIEELKSLMDVFKEKKTDDS